MCGRGGSITRRDGYVMTRPAWQRAIARLIAEWFGTGQSPLAPGTAGSLGTLPLFWLMARLEAGLYWGLTVLIILLGVWAAGVRAEELGDEDPSSVVIDEVVGVLLALGLVRSYAWPYWALAWVLFRVLDIKKPWIIDRAQELEPAGVGIMADDVLAGLTAGGLAALTAAAGLFLGY